MPPPPRKRPNNATKHQPREAEPAHEQQRAARPIALLSPATVVLTIAVLLILLAFTVLHWFRSGPGFFQGLGRRSTFSGTHSFLDGLQAQVAREHLGPFVSFGSSTAYFSWLGWLLLGAAVVSGALSVSAFGALHWWTRWLATVVGVAGVALTFVSLNLITFAGNSANNANAPTFRDFFAHASLGVWAAAGGFLLISVAPMLPRGRR